MLGLDVCNDEVSISQYFGVVNINRLGVCSAPRDNGPGIARGQTFQDGSLVQGHGDVLWSSNDARSLRELGAWSCAEKRRTELRQVLWSESRQNVVALRTNISDCDAGPTNVSHLFHLVLGKHTEQQDFTNVKREMLDTHGVTVRVASVLLLRLAMLVAMQR